MAKIVREKFPVLFTPKWPWTLTGSDFTCLEILGCNSRGPSSFSDARLNFRSFADPERPPEFYDAKYVSTIPEKFVFRGVLYDLVFNENVKKEAVDRALENLGNFLINEQHLKCLKAVAKKPKCEAEVQSALALHLFKPLSGDASTTVDERVYQHSKVPKECLNCKEPVRAGDTSFGCREVWYGYGDILLERNLVKIDTKRDEESSATQEYSYEIGNGEPDILSNLVKTDTIRNKESSATQGYSHEIGSGEPKKPRVDPLDSGGADIGFAEDETDFLLTANDSYMPYGPGKVVKQNPILQQVVSQTIVNAFLQAKNFPDLQGCFIPSFLASEKYITIHMYNTSLDCLLTQTRAMSLWADDHHNSYDTGTIIAVWMALNMHSFSRSFPNEEENFESPWYHKSSFHALTKDELTFYQNSIQRPLDRHHVCKFEETIVSVYSDQQHKFHQLLEKYTDG